MGESSRSGRSDPDGNSFVFHLCNAPQNNGKYCDPEVDAAHKLARSKSDPAERKKADETGTRKQRADGAIIDRYHPQGLGARSDKGEGHMLGRQFRLNDLGLRCMAEHVALTIATSLTRTEAPKEPKAAPAQPPLTEPQRAPG